MKKLLILVVLAVLPFSSQADFEVGGSLPFYIDTDLDGGEFGGYGFHIEAKKRGWFLSYDRLQNAVRRDGNKVCNQDFITFGKRLKVYRGVFIQTGLSLNETSNVLGSAVSFNVGLGYEFRRTRLTWSHWSNANTDRINHGFDTLTLNYKL